VGLVLVSPCLAGTAPVQSPLARALLDWAARAGARTGYHGTEVVSAWTPVGTVTRILDVRQKADGTRSVRVAGDGTSAAGTAQSGVPAQLDAGSARALALLGRTSTLSVAGHEDVAGRRTTVVVVSREGHPAARLWVDTACGLLLRLEVFDLHGRLSRMAGFLEVSVDRVGGSPSTGRGLLTAPAPVSIDGAAASLLGSDSPGTTADGTGDQGVRGDQDPGDQDAVPAALLERFRRAGDPCPTELPGGYVLVDARRSDRADSGSGTDTGTGVLHLTYTDGLSSLSLFVQHGRLAPGALAGYRTVTWDGIPVRIADGWPVRAVWESDATVVTLIGDASTDEIQAVVQALPRPAGPSGALARLRHDVTELLGLLPGR